MRRTEAPVPPGGARDGAESRFGYMPMSATVRVTLFAQVREHAGCDHVTFRPDETASAADVRAVLSARYPALAALLSRSAIAVNRRTVADGHPVRPGDEVAVLPPVAGG